MPPAAENTIETETNEKVSHYKMYNVIFHNDDTTSRDFVSMILIRFFEKETKDAIKLMIEIHEKGSGIAGIYPYEGAEFRVEQTTSLARAQGFPLSCSIELA